MFTIILSGLIALTVKSFTDNLIRKSSSTILTVTIFMVSSITMLTYGYSCDESNLMAFGYINDSDISEITEFTSNPHTQYLKDSSPVSYYVTVKKDKPWWVSFPILDESFTDDSSTALVETYVYLADQE